MFPSSSTYTPSRVRSWPRIGRRGRVDCRAGSAFVTRALNESIVARLDRESVEVRRASLRVTLRWSFQGCDEQKKQQCARVSCHVGTNGVEGRLRSLLS